MSERRPTLAIIVATYALERLKDVGELLDAIHGQTYDNTIYIILQSRAQSSCMMGLPGSTVIRSMKQGMHGE